MIDRGFMPMPRSWLDDPDLDDGPMPWPRRLAWAWLLMNARFAPGRINVAGQNVHLKRGQLSVSTRFLAKAWHWDDSKVCRFLKRISECGKIEASIEAGQTLITICNYNAFHEFGFEDEAASEAAARQQRGSSEAKKKEGKNGKECKQESTSPACARTAEGPGLFDDMLEAVPVQPDLLPTADVVKLAVHDFDRVKNRWNAMVRRLGDGGKCRIPIVKDATREREAALRRTVRKLGLEGIDALLERIAASAFLRGEKGQFTAKFDWVFVKGNYVQILEGNYDDAPEPVRPAAPRAQTAAEQRQSRAAQRLADMGLTVEQVLRRPSRNGFAGTTIDGDSVELRDIEMKEAAL